MATIVLQAAGAALLGGLGPVAGVIGAAAGAVAGYVIDQALINSFQKIEGPRLTGARPFTAEEGVSLPRLYGTARLGGIMIWATRFEEESSTSRVGGKTGPKVTEYSYFANVAFALCEGEIAGIRRVWADGREVDLENVELRLHTGTETQPADPLISARQGIGNAPAYRGVAYVVLEHFALADYGNRIPQFQFEVMRPVGSLAGQVRAISLIPGSTEYGLSFGLVTRELREGQTEGVNRHILHGASDMAASLDELQMLFPKLEHVALVCSWFGDDLRAAECRIRPKVASSGASGFSQPWAVSGLARLLAPAVSMFGGSAAYGGTPSDRTILQAIGEIKDRGLKVTLSPFIMMDVPAGNELPDPYGGAAQPAYPWRGRITCDPAPAAAGTADKTAAARSQVATFLGSAEAGDFVPGEDTVRFEGDAGDWGYRRFVLHFAHLAVAAGGVDAFAIGSELRGLTTLRDEGGAFPFVEALCDLAGDVRAVLGPDASITYGADWSEYFGHHPDDGSGDVLFHLDPLWAHPEIGAVGIDNYMPLSDWRDDDYLGANPDGAAGPYDLSGLMRSIAGGEGFDWFYPDLAARVARERTPIADGAYGKDWTFRYKDLQGWWSQLHFDRPGGVEQPTPTAWVPCSKPIWFTELGSAAVDKGPNQPNVFPDPKSIESAIPFFSSGGRADLAQRRFFEAHALRWDPESPLFDEADNPVSPLYDGRMLDFARIYLWAWDARPFPAFPLQSGSWSDGGNWHNGHWLNGRFGNPLVGDLINAILADHGLPRADVSRTDGTVVGYVIENPASARSGLEPICNLFGISCREDGGWLAFAKDEHLGAQPVELSEFVSDGSQPAMEVRRTPDHDLPAEAVLTFRDPFVDYQAATVRQRRFGAAGSRQHALVFPGVLEREQGRALLCDWLKRAWNEREQATFAIAGPRGDVVPGALVMVPASGSGSEFLVTGIEDGLARRVTARQVFRSAPTPWMSSNPAETAEPPQTLFGLPLAFLLDLPLGLGEELERNLLRVAAWQKPWKSQQVFASPEGSGFASRTVLARPADVGVLTQALSGGFEGRIDRGAAMTVELWNGEMSSVSRTQLLNGANTAAIRSSAGSWEVVQFETADEIAPNVWRLGGLLRGQLGTGDAMAAGAGAGARFVVLNEAVKPAGLLSGEEGLALNWRIGASGLDFSGDHYAQIAATGGLRALLPLSPVHLKGRLSGGDLELSWIRRGRIGADDWLAGEIPLGEQREEYRLEISPAGGPPVRTVVVDVPAHLYESADISADFGSPPAEIDVSVRQFSAAVGWGVAAARRIVLG